MAEEKGIGKKVVEGVKKAADGFEGFASKIGRAGKATESYTGSVESAAQSTVELLTTPWKKMAQLIGTNTDAFEKLNQSGMSFGNSMNNIRMGAAEMRMSLDDFTKLMGENQKSFASLGSTATKSAENFTKLGKEMQQSGLAEKMTQMGFGYQELNEILAIQIGASKEKIGNDEASRKKTIESAMALAEEMDSLAKLTGMSRKEQEDSRKANQRDMQLEAAMRLQTRNMSADDAKAYRANMLNIIETTKAERGEAAAAAAKEFITTGTLKTSEAMASASIDSGGFQAMQRQVEATKKGDTKGAQEAREDARRSSMALQDNEAYLTIASQVGGTAGKVTTGQMEKMQTQYEGTKALDEENRRNGITKDLNGLMEQQKDIIKKEQTARDGLTAGMIAARNDLADANAAAVRRVGEVTGKGSKLEKEAGAIAAKRTEGRQKEYGEMIAKDTPIGDILQKGSDVGAAAIKGIEDFSQALKKLVTELNIGYAKLGKDPDANKKAGSRDGGTLEKTGSPIEPMDALVKIHKGETVLSPEATKGLSAQLSESTKGMTQMSQASISKMLGQPLGAAPKSAGGAMPGIDINKILTDIKTTVSKVEISNWPKEIKDIGKVAPAQTQTATSVSKPVEKPAEAKPVEKPAEAKPVETPAEAKPVVAKPVEKPAEVKTPNSSESYKINGKEVDKKQFDQHMEANPELANLMNGIKPKAGGDASSGNPMADALENVKSMQEQIGKVNEEAVKKELDNKKDAVKQTQEAIDEQTNLVQKGKEKEFDIYNSHILHESGLNLKQRDMFGELAKLSVEDSKAKLEANQKRKEETLAERKAIDAKADAIEALAKKEGRALTESEQEQIKALEKEATAKSKARREENARMTDENKVLESLIRQKEAAERAGLEIGIVENGKMVKLVEKNSAKIAEDMKDALPVKDIEKGKELLEERIALQNKAEEDAMLAEEAEIARIDAEAQAKFAAAEEEAIAREEVAALLPKTIDLEKQRIELQNKAEQDAIAYEEEEIARIDAEAQAKFAADEEAAIAQADLAALLPKTIDLEKMGGDMLANMMPDAKYSDQDSESRTMADINQPSIDKAKYTKFSDISLDANGMPVVKSKAKELKKEEPKKEDTSSDDAETAKFKRQAEAKKAEEEKKKGDGGKEQKSNLDDVVKKLDLLNTTMNSLIKKTEEMSANQVKATKGIASGNLFGAL